MFEVCKYDLQITLFSFAVKLFWLCSSPHLFTPYVVFPVQQPAVTNSSSSEDEAERSSGVLIRRRRVRRNTAGVTDPEDEEQEAVVLESRSADEKDERPEEEEQEHEEEQEEAEPTAAANDLGHSWDGSILNKCVLLALIIAISMGFGHFYGKKLKSTQKI